MDKRKRDKERDALLEIVDHGKKDAAEGNTTPEKEMLDELRELDRKDRNKGRRLKVHPVMGKIGIGYDPIEDLSADEWGELDRKNLNKNPGRSRGGQGFWGRDC